MLYLLRFAFWMFFSIVMGLGIGTLGLNNQFPVLHVLLAAAVIGGTATILSYLELRDCTVFAPALDLLMAISSGFVAYCMNVASQTRPGSVPPDLAAFAAFAVWLGWIAWRRVEDHARKHPEKLLKDK